MSKEFALTLIAPVIDLTQHLTPDEIETLEKYRRRIVLSPQGAWDARGREVVPMLWSRMTPHLRVDSHVYGPDEARIQSLLLLWPEANPCLLTGANPALVPGPYEYVQPANHTRVFQFGWRDVSIAARLPDRKHALSTLCFACSHTWEMQSRYIWFEFSDHEAPSIPVEYLPPASLNQFVIFTREV